MASVLELAPIPIDSEGATAIRLFRLALNDVTVELSSLGASITSVLLPNYSQPDGRSNARDDVVLSYNTPKEQYEDKNPLYLCAIVGRVASRIKDGRFQLVQGARSPSAEEGGTLEAYQLARNNAPNHLHGGVDGFCTKIWDARITDDGSVEFALASPDGDQGYPGGVRVTATYSLAENGDGCGETTEGARLCLKMRASLLPGEVKSTPIGLAQHSYFNLASHSCKRMVLDHKLQLPNCTKFTPLDNTSIPTREVRPVDGSMSFLEERVLADALIRYGEDRAGLERSEAISNVHRILNDDATTTAPVDASELVARVPAKGGAPGANLDGSTPYGFDHSFAIDGYDDNRNLRLAAVLSHPPTARSLKVFTTAPGLVVYTSNYMDGRAPSPKLCKDGARYCQWQGICLETQTYPDSIYPSDDDVGGDDEFARGRCFVLRPGGPDYVHLVEYEFGSISV